VLGTTGRICGQIEKNHLCTDYLKLLILDEADLMLDSGFRDDVSKIFEFLYSNIKIGLFSATMRKDILDLTQ